MQAKAIASIRLQRTAKRQTDGADLYAINPELRGFQCLRCCADHPIGDYPLGCPNCHAAGFPSSVRAQYTPSPIFPGTSGNRKGGMARFAHKLPYTSFPSLGEGETPLIELPELTKRVGVEEVFVKCESQEPTGSHKDRMSCLVVARAAAIGAKTVVAASSGNAGISLAAYAAVAGLRCVVVTTPQIKPIWRNAIEMLGAELVATERPLDRWAYIAERVKKDGWYAATNFATPPVGSNCWGVDGYKTVAFELFEQSGPQQPDVIVVPSARGDLLWGVYEGYRTLQEEGHVQKLPKLVAVEPHPRLVRVLGGEDYRGDFPGSSAMVSIGGSTIAWQAVVALECSNGLAVAVDETQVQQDQKELAGLGLYLELSSVAALTGLRTLCSRGELEPGSRAVLLGTARGLREMTGQPELSRARLEPVSGMPVP